MKSEIEKIKNNFLKEKESLNKKINELENEKNKLIENTKKEIEERVKMNKP